MGLPATSLLPSRVPLHRTASVPAVPSSSRAPADVTLLERIAAGDPRAFEALYDRHGGAAYSLALHITGDRGRAEDVTQEAFLSVWRSRERYDPARGAVKSWLLGVVRNRSIDDLRRHGRHARHRASDEGLEEYAEAAERTDAQALLRDDARAVREALDGLPPDQRAAIELAYFGGLSHTEIARALRVPVGTVKGRMRLGLEKLRGRLGAEREPA
jgi:RNA polymerase sigma-70 factor, ECF subfamily